MPDGSFLENWERAREYKFLRSSKNFHSRVVKRIRDCQMEGSWKISVHVSEYFYIHKSD